MALTFAVLPNKISQGFRVCLRPDCAALQTGVALPLKLRAAVHREGEEPEIIWPEHDVRKILLARPPDLSLRYLRPTAFETRCHGAKSANAKTHSRRAAGVQHDTEASSRRRVK